jgi:hypothetical protein
MRDWMRTPAALLAVLVAAAVAAGVAWATIPDGSGAIHACSSLSDKSLRVVDSGACKAGETPVSWSQDAVRGSQGPEGPQGPQGATGPQGPAGLTYATSVADIAYADPKIGGFFKELTCPTGTKALAGTWSWQMFMNGMPPADVESFPIDDDSWGFAVGASSESVGLAMVVGLTCVYAR